MLLVLLLLLERHQVLTNLLLKKVEKTLNVQTLDRDLVAKGGPVALHDDSLTGTSEDPNTHSSARVSGQIIYQSPNVFTITTPTTYPHLQKYYIEMPPLLLL